MLPYIKITLKFNQQQLICRYSSKLVIRCNILLITNLNITVTLTLSTALFYRYSSNLSYAVIFFVITNLDITVTLKPNQQRLFYRYSSNLQYAAICHFITNLDISFRYKPIPSLNNSEAVQVGVFYLPLRP